MDNSITEKFEKLKREFMNISSLLYKDGAIQKFEEIDQWGIVASNVKALGKSSGVVNFVFKLKYKPDFFYTVGGKKYKSVQNGVILCGVPMERMEGFNCILNRMKDGTQCFANMVTKIIVGEDTYPITDLIEYKDDADLMECEINRMTLGLYSFKKTR